MFTYILSVLNAIFACLQSTSGDGSLGPENNNAAALPLEHRSGGGYDVGLPLSSGPLQGPHDEAWPLQTVPDAVKIKHLQVQCEKTHMRVNIEFDRPFYGVIFSKGMKYRFSSERLVYSALESYVRLKRAPTRFKRNEVLTSTGFGRIGNLTG